MTLALHQSQVHSSGVIQVMSLQLSSRVSTPSLAEAGCKTCEQIVLLLVFIA